VENVGLVRRPSLHIKWNIDFFYGNQGDLGSWPAGLDCACPCYRFLFPNLKIEFSIKNKKLEKTSDKSEKSSGFQQNRLIFGF
jgi:hypothetical protein